MAGNYNFGGLFGDGDFAYPDGAVAVAETPVPGSTRQRVPALLTQAVVAGAAAGNITVTGIAVGDTLIAVTRYIGAGVAVLDVTDLTSEFTITAADTINNGGGTNTTGDKLQVWWWAK